MTGKVTGELTEAEEPNGPTGAEVPEGSAGAEVTGSSGAEIASYPGSYWLGKERKSLVHIDLCMHVIIAYKPCGPEWAGTNCTSIRRVYSR